MTQNEFAEALSRLVGEAEYAGLDRETVLAVIKDLALAIREAED